MTIMLAVLAPTLGFLGIVFGAFLNEGLRQRSRREQFSAIVFEKRLAIYEELIARIGIGHKLIAQIFESELTKAQRHELVSAAVHGVAEFVDQNSLYIDEEISAHCVALFMGTEDIPDAPADERRELQYAYNDMRNEALRMISEDSGVAEINRLFKSINQPQITGPFVELLRKLKNENGRS